MKKLFFLQLLVSSCIFFNVACAQPISIKKQLAMPRGLAIQIQG